MNFKHVIIVTYGRSGSTLLQGILNSIDDLLVKGENFNFCYGLYQSYINLKKLTRKGVATASITHPFYGACEFDEKVFLADAYALLESQIVTHGEKIPVWGFKEIRYLPAAISVGGGYQLQPYLSFLDKLLPECGFVFLTRDHEEVSSSGFWKDVPKEKVQNMLVAFEKEANEWSAHKKNSYWLTYSDIVDSRLIDLYDFLGADYSRKKIENILSVEYSYNNKIIK